MLFVKYMLKCKDLCRPHVSVWICPLFVMPDWLVDDSVIRTKHLDVGTFLCRIWRWTSTAVPSFMVFRNGSNDQMVLVFRCLKPNSIMNCGNVLPTTFISVLVFSTDRSHTTDEFPTDITAVNTGDRGPVANYCRRVLRIHGYFCRTVCKYIQEL